MRCVRLFLLGGLSIGFVAGCTGDGAIRQKLFRPGPAQYQRQKAERFDPYNEIPIGPRDDSSRPPDYLRPNPEASRGRWEEWGLPRFGHP